MCPEITRLVVSTDSPEIAAVARQFGADVPFVRPSKLAEDDTPMWPVVRHALNTLEGSDESSYEFLLLLDPTSPAREPADVTKALEQLQKNAAADGIIGASQPEFNPIWHCVVERNGWMEDLTSAGSAFNRRQDVPRVYRVNGSLYLWRSEFVRREPHSWRTGGRHLIYETPEFRAMSIDTAQEFRRAEILVESGLICFPWMSR
jgi:N-acylneuraminate cytidylyltransferase